jgi:hypothetical protein
LCIDKTDADSQKFLGDMERRAEQKPGRPKKRDATSRYKCVWEDRSSEYGGSSPRPSFCPSPFFLVGGAGEGPKCTNLPESSRDLKKMPEMRIYIWAPDYTVADGFERVVDIRVKEGTWESVLDRLKERLHSNWQLVRVYCNGLVVLPDPIAHADARTYSLCFVNTRHLAAFNQQP